MKSKMKVQDLLAKKDALAKLFTSEDLPINISYRLSKANTAVGKEFDYVDQAKNKLVQKYGTKNERGDLQVKVDDNKAFNAFTADFLKVLGEEIEVEIDPVKMEDLGNSLKLTPAELSHLVGFVIEDPDKKEEPETKEEQ